MTKYGMAIERDINMPKEDDNASSSQIKTNPGVALETTTHLPITGHKLNGNNYLQWSQSVLMFVSGKGKDEYLTGETVAPETGDPTFKQWKTENNMVMSWLINSMTNEIGENFLLYTTANEIWNDAKEFYSSKDNTSAIFEIETMLQDLKQGDLSVTQFYNTLTRQWQQLDVFEEHKWTCTADSKKYKEIVEKKRIFKFLMGLNKNLDEVRGRILGTKPLPSIREVFSEVRREESRKKVMLGESFVLPVAEQSALAARGVHNHAMDNRLKKTKRLWCDYCQRSGHTRDTCWKIHGKPADWKPSKPTMDKESRGNHVSSEEGSHTIAAHAPQSSPFNQEQLEALQKMFSLMSSQNNPKVASLAQKGNFLSAFTVKSGNLKPWIVDSGASDHMTGDKSLFHHYSPCYDGMSVKIADGTLSKVAGTGSIILSEDIELKSVLHVPNLDCNLLSVSKLTHDLNCVAKLVSNLCEFQTLDSGRTIGSARICSGLYLLQADQTPPRQTHNAVRVESSSQSNKDSAIMLWHYRLGHPNFLYLKKMFPSLFANKNPKLFQCEVCQFSKHVRHSYSMLPYKASHPFSLIHSDVWGPSRIKNITGSRWFVLFVDDHSRITWLFLMKEKSELGNIFRKFNTMIQTQFQTKIQVLKTDNAKEYFESSLREYLDSHGIIHQSSCVNTPQQNGVAERKNRHILEVARSLMFTTHVPKFLWGEAVSTATYLINRMPSRVLKFQTPFQVISNCFPQTRVLSTLPIKVFGCSVFVHHQASKLDPRALKCIFVGYSPNQKGYKCYSPISRKFYNSMDVTFFENQPFYTKTDIQGENFTQEYQLWDIDTLESGESSLHVSPQIDQTDPTMSTHLLPLPVLDQSCDQPELSSIESPDQSPIQPDQSNSPTVQPSTSTHPAEIRELRVYTRKNKNQEGNEQQIQHCLESNPSLEIENTQGNENCDSIPTVNYDDRPIASRKDKRTCTHHPICKFISYDKLSSHHLAFVSSLDKIQVPNSVHEALLKPEWKEAIFEEIHALEKNGTWELSNLPSGKHPVGCKWIFTIKQNSDGSINRFKARLVAKGFTQSYGIDYQETFAPVAKLNTVRILLSLASNLDWPLYQMDVKNAFLNGDLEEEVYMDIPPGFETSENANKVCKLKKSLYGLKQSPRAWFDRFTKVVKKSGYIQCQTDHTMFLKQSPSGKKAILIVYVDDIVLTGDHEEEIKRLKSLLAKEFEIKDLGNLKYFLGMEVARSKKGISVSQRKYVLDLLKETGMLGCKPSETPMDATVKLGNFEKGTPVDKGRYQRLVGKLIYLSHTRPDISFAVSTVSQFMNCPTEEHMEALYRILRYLKMTPGQGLFFQKSTSREIEIFTDADWAGSVTDRRSTSGYCTFVWGNLVTWRSKKQPVVSRSSAEAEFRALSQGICEGIWIKRVLHEIGILNSNPIKVLCDNQSAISIAKNPVHHDRTKHVEIDRHFIKENIENGTISLQYTPTSQQTADILTKAVPRKTFENLTSKLGLLNIYNLA
ncbi:putative mitochondrial protein [Trifolium repens]|jgi:hypothetical protein|nr:putative mitochondrial protein [Trifolium repens]